MASIACIPSVPAPGDAAGLRDRARGALLGLAVGDALGAPAENMKPSEIRAAGAASRDTWPSIPRARTTPSTRSSPACCWPGTAPRSPSPMWRRPGTSGSPTCDEGPFRGAGFSERGTLENLRRGLAAPISAQHRHAWSDGLAMRAAPFGVFAAGRPAEAARLVAIDGSVSHDGEGIYGGQAVAAGVAAAMAGAPTIAVVAVGPGGGPRRLLDGPLPAPGGGGRPPRRTRGPLRRRHRRLPLDRPGPRGRRPRLRRVRGGRRRLHRVGADGREHGPRRRHDGGGGRRPGRRDPGRVRDPARLGGRHRPGPRQLPPLHGGPPRPGRGGTADAGRGRQSGADGREADAPEPAADFSPSGIRGAGRRPARTHRRGWDGSGAARRRHAPPPTPNHSRKSSVRP